MATEINYACTLCGNDTKREELTVKKSTFLEMGEGARTVRSRVVAWLCPRCVIGDADWNRPKFAPPRVESTRELIDG